MEYVEESSQSGTEIPRQLIFSRRMLLILVIFYRYKNPDLFYGIAITVKDNLTIEAVQEKLSSLPEVVGMCPRVSG